LIIRHGKQINSYHVSEDCYHIQIAILDKTNKNIVNYSYRIIKQSSIKVIYIKIYKW